MTCLLTRGSARAACACYSDERIDELVPPEGLTLAQVVKLDIPLADIVWAMIRAMGLPDRILRLSAVDSARRALARVETPDPRSVHAVDVAERHAHGLATDAELAAAEAAAWAAWAAEADATDAARAAAAWAAAADATDAARAAAADATDAARAAAARAAADVAWAAWAAAAWAAADAATEERRQQIAALVRLVEEET